MIVGIDEVGRGPWAGPLVFGAVVLGGADIEGLTDSKKLTKKRREQLDVEIRSHAEAFGLGWVQADELDEVGMSKACELACRRALEQITTPYSEIIIDGMVNFLKNTGKGPYVMTMKQADLLVPSVSAASILAKVARDQFMEEQDTLFPGYGFGAHVGYGTAAHREALARLGVTPLHRKSFAPIAALIDMTTSSPAFAPAIPTTSTNSTPTISATSQNHLTKNRVTIQSKVTRKKAKGLRDVGDSQESQGVEWRGRVTVAQGDDALVVPVTTRGIGDKSEQAAADYLTHEGYAIVERNWKTKACEIDIVAEKDNVWYFVEVKHRKTDWQGGGLAAITPKKLEQMKFATRMYAHWNKADDADMRCMVVTTTCTPPVVTQTVQID